MPVSERATSEVPMMVKHVTKENMNPAVTKVFSRSLPPSNYKGSTSSTTDDPLKNYKPPEDYTAKVPLYVLVLTYLTYFLLAMFGHLRDFFGKRFRKENYIELIGKNGCAPLTNDFESRYIRRIYRRIRDCWYRPTTGIPSNHIHVLIRKSSNYNKTFQFSGEVRKCLNLSSYNYLGFAEPNGPCASSVIETIKQFGVVSSQCDLEGGRLSLHRELEELVARFVGKEAAIICNMGFATNACNIPALVGPGSLIISDELNHSSLIFGSRLSEAKIRVYKHNNMEDLEKLLREVISQGQPRKQRPWTKIIVIAEGLYSMEGTIVSLPQLLALKKKYKFYLFLDEAHSIGAIGLRGRGVCDLYGVDPVDVDVLMGTFTKSFGAAGGYVAGSRSLINCLRSYGHSSLYADVMSPPVCQQILKSMRIIMGEDNECHDGLTRLHSIYNNSVYFCNELRKMGFLVTCEVGSPVIPLLLFQPTLMAAFSRELLARNIAVVVVGYPATSIHLARARFCISASHTQEDLDYALRVISEIGDMLRIKFYTGKNQAH